MYSYVIRIRLQQAVWSIQKIVPCYPCPAPPMQTILGSYTAGILEEWNLTMELFNAKAKSPGEGLESARKVQPWSHATIGGGSV